MVVTISLNELIRQEIIQRREEGCDVSAIELLWQPDLSDEKQLMQIYRDLQSLDIKPDFPYIEPSTIEEILTLKGEYDQWPVDIDDALLDRIYGAWLGRIAGCMLGKPVEGWSLDMIRTYLTQINEYPLANYIRYIDDKLPEDAERVPMQLAARGRWRQAIVDDDTNYTVLCMKIMEEFGVAFTTSDIGFTWLRTLPFLDTYTAERQAYVNMINDLPISEVPLYLNPYREWIGAQIRADFWGYCAPGRPAKAAEFAYRDAALTHVKNGIYGEMFCAAAISAALAVDDINMIVATGLSVIPNRSRLAETVRDCLRWRDQYPNWQDAHNKMLQSYCGNYNPVHTNNNLAIVLIALLYGWPDMEKVITIATMQGMDTDCNAATAGSIVGAALGANALPDKWTKPINNTLETSVSGFFQCNIKELAERTMRQASDVMALDQLWSSESILQPTPA